MKNNKLTVLLSAALASGIVLSACGKSTDNRRSKKKSKIDVVSSEKEEEDIDVTEDEEGSAPQIVELDHFDPIDLKLSDAQKNLNYTPTKLEDGTEVPDCGRLPDQLGAGNATNGGYAVGNEDYQYYVVHFDKHITSIVMEDCKTKEEYFIYQITPGPDVKNTLDSLILDGDDLYFRENDSVVRKLNLTDHKLTTVLEGEVHLLTLYQDKLYYSLDGSIRRADRDGSNEEVLFESQVKDGPVNVSFCIFGTQIFYCDPQERSDDGPYYGKLCVMNLDGSDPAEIPTEATVRNNDARIAGDGTLYFVGRGAYDDGVEYEGPMSVKVDGSDLFFYEVKDVNAKFNYLNGTLYMLADNRFCIIEGLNRYQIAGPDSEPGSNIAYGVCIVGQWFYVMTENPAFSTGYITERYFPEGNYGITLDSY